MEKSIETIWSEGFSKKEDLLAPKIDKLYKQKSKLLFEKFKKRFWIYNYSIIPVALLFAIGFGLSGRIILGIYLLFLFLAFFFFNKKIWKSFKNIDININSYQYFLAFRNSIKKMVSLYTWLYTVGTPVILFPVYWLLFRESKKFELLINEVQMPYLILYLVILAFVVSALTVLGYRLEVKIIYGRLIKKLDNTIADMEELKS